MTTKEQIDELDVLHEQPTCRSCGRAERTSKVCEECRAVSEFAGEEP